MRKFILLMLFGMLFLSCSNLFAQENYIKLSSAKTQNPSYIFNKNIIGSEFCSKGSVIQKRNLKKRDGIEGIIN